MNPAAVKNAVGVSRLWRVILNSGKFWRWARLYLSLSPLEQQQKNKLIGSLVSRRRFDIVPEIRIKQGSKVLVEAVLKAVSEGTTSLLKTLISRLQGASGSFKDSIDAALLSRAALQVKNFTISGGLDSQRQDLLSAVAESDELTLKTLDLGHSNCLTEVSLDILGVGRGYLDLLYSDEQITHMLTKIKNTKDLKPT